MSFSKRFRLFVYLWLRSLIWGIVLGIGSAVLVGLCLGMFNANSGDDMGQGLAFLVLLFGVGNLTNYIAAILIGRELIRKSRQNEKVYMYKAVALCICSLIISCFLPPLLIFGSVLSSFVVTLSIKKAPPVKFV